MASDPEAGAKADIVLHTDEDGAAIRFARSSAFRITHDMIEVFAEDVESSEYLIPIQLSGIVMAVWLERAGSPVLHGSAVASGDSCVGFLATKGGGKSSLAASLVAHGLELVTDDLLAVDTIDGRVLAHSSYPQFRMERDTAAHFLGSADGFALVHPAYEKVRVPVERLGSARRGVTMLRALIVPSRGDAREVSFEPLTGAGALAEVIGASFLGDMVPALGVEQRRFGVLAQLAETTPTFVMHYPDGYDKLRSVASAVDEFLASSDVRFG